MLPIRFRKEDLYVEIYSPGLAGLISDSGFDCGYPDLNEFIKSDACAHQTENISQTYLLIRDSKLLAFFCLSSDSIQLGKNEGSKLRSMGFCYPSFPALKVGRLAVAKEYHRRGIGRIAISAAQGLALSVQAFAGCRFLTIDAKSGARGFWEKLGFTQNLKENLRARETESMRFDRHVPEKG